MTHSPTPRHRRRAAQAGLVAAALLASGFAAHQSFAASGAATAAGSAPGAEGGTAVETRGFYDSRQPANGAARAQVQRTAARSARSSATAAFRASLPGQAVLDIDGTTGTVRMLSRLDGHLTGPHSASARTVALDYVRAHSAALGLTGRDVDGFRLNRRYVDILGTTHLFFRQVAGGVPVFGNGLTAAVDRRGRLLTVGGSPVSGVSAPPPRTGRLATAEDALAASLADLGDRGATPGPHDSARQVLFVTPHGVQRGWYTVVTSAAQPAVSVFSASSGALLLRRPISHDLTGDSGSSGKAFQYFPGARRGGTQIPVDFTGKGWLGAHAQRLRGNNSHTYSDVNDDGIANPREEVHPRVGQRWSYRLKPRFPAHVSFCGNPYPCSWKPNQAFSWRANRAQNATQVFYYVNNWHDHLMRAPIGFTEAAGNFQSRNATHQGHGGDAVDTQTDDGANTDHGLPDGSHIDNANMSTPPDGTPPTMQMYLQHQPFTSYPDGDPFSPTNVGDEADTVYHEYTHGLSNRLVVDVQGSSTLGGVQAGAMGEAWSDWYAMDYLVAKGFQRDRADRVDVRLFQYDGEGTYFDRTEPIDCKVGEPARRCPGGATGHRGGYTYADYAHVVGGPEVHGDGEIWAQTLWDLRDRIGRVKAESVVTRAMELAPANPSYLDMRNALLVADVEAYDGAQQDAIWRVFARRGMGFYAGSLGGDDSTPGASSSVPPATVTTARITGTVTDQDSGDPLAGIPVTLAFQGRGLANPVAVTDADGHYSLGPVPTGRYPKLTVAGAGYVSQTSAVTVRAAGGHADFAVRRNWAASSGGASISDFNGPDFGAFGCGPDQAIDSSEATGWSSTTGDDNGDPTNVMQPKFIVVDLGAHVDVADFGVDPAATCGDGGSASTGDYRIETSPDGSTWTTAASGTFTVDDRGRINEVAPTAGAAGVRFVRFTILGNQTPDFSTNCPDGAYSGCTYSDLTELEVYGTASP